ncbi:MAG: 30S ribosomal protein S2 [Clostridiales bacterium]|nr:30S ribosomal protein S2 [Clostridiales bacterium]
MSVISMKQLLEAGCHFGHQTRKWNPKMKKYIFTDRNGIHILNLEDTSKKVDEAYVFIKEKVLAGANVLFIGTKKQASEIVKQEAERSNMFYVNSRWLGGTLTNFTTLRKRIDRMNKLNNMEALGDFDLLPKKEVIKLRAERDKLAINLTGIKDMTGIPGLIILVDPHTEHIAVKEAKRLGIPVVGIVDTNSDPDDVDVCIPANDDAIGSVKLILSALTDAILEAKGGEILHDLNANDEDVSMEAMVTGEIVKEEAQEEKATKKRAPKKEAKVESNDETENA